MSVENSFGDVGVSPVVGVVLMVAVTVALVALVSLIGLDLQGNVSESSDVSVRFTDGDTVKIVRNQNVETVEIRDKSGSVIGSIDSVGGQAELGSSQDHTIVAVQDDGTEEVVRKIGSNQINVEDTVVLDGSSGQGSFESSIKVGSVTTE